MWLFLLVLPAAVLSATLPNCEPARREGVNMTIYPKSVSHSLHSLTVEDIRYFFDDQFPIDNSVPTVNLDLTGSYVVPYAPSRPSPFKFPGGAAFDFILNSNDQPDKFGAKGQNNLEEIAHQMHMMECWHHASKMYKDIAAKHINKEEVCPCLVNEDENGIIDELVNISKWLKNWITVPIVGGERRIPRALSHSFWKNNGGWGTFGEHSLRKRDTEEAKSTEESIEGAAPSHAPILESIDGEEYQVVPELKDSKSWKWWKPTMVEENKTPYSKEVSREFNYNFAMYMYCKINM
jgi:hypothetical protein